MATVFEKLNLKEQREILVVNAPASFESELLALKEVNVLRDPKKAKSIQFALAFATKQAEVEALSASSQAKPRAMSWSGLLTRKAPPSGSNASSTATTVGIRCEARASIRSAKLRSMKIGRRFVSGEWNLSNQP